MYIRAGSIFPDFLPGQIPDSGHVYEVYGVNQIILGWKNLPSGKKTDFLPFFAIFRQTAFFKHDGAI